MNLTDRFLRHPAADTALSGRGWSLTYGDLDEVVGRWRGALTRDGVVAGDRVGILVSNQPRSVIAHLAVLGLGAVSVPLNPEAPAAELRRQLAQVGAGRVIGVDLVGSGVDLGIEPFDVDAAGRAEPVRRVDVEGDDPAVLLFTSGTAAAPRPAVLTTANLAASLDALTTHSSGLTDHRHVILAVIPLFHIFGLNAVLHLGLSMGAEIVLTDQRRPEELAAIVAEFGVTVLGGPPTLWNQIAAEPTLAPDALSSLRLAVSGAAKLAPATAVAVADRFGVRIVEGYGLTETCAALATAIDTDAPIGSVGRLLPGVEARIVDSSGNDALVGDPGELWVRGPMVSPGYFRPGLPVEERTGADPTPEDPETGAGWFRTGDVAVVDDDGHLAIVDRIRDIVVVSGFNVYPGEVEAVLRNHDAVAEAAVIGRPDERTGEQVVAYVVPVDGGEPTVEDLLTHCREQLARYKVPAVFEITDSLPTGVVGKLRRRELG